MAYRALIIDNDYFFVSSLKNLRCWMELDIDIIDIEVNPTYGVQKFNFLRPELLILSDPEFYISTDIFLKQISSADFIYKIIYLRKTDYSIPKFENGRLGAVLDKDDFSEGIFKDGLSKSIAQILSDSTALSAKEIIVKDNNLVEKNTALIEIINGATALRSTYLITKFNLNINYKSIYLVLCKPQSSLVFHNSIIREIANVIRHELENHNGGEFFITETGMICLIINDYSKEFNFFNNSQLKVLVKQISDHLENLMHEEFKYIISDNISYENISAGFHSLKNKANYIYFTYDRKITLCSEYKLNEPNWNDIERCTTSIMINSVECNEVAVLQNIETLYLSYVKTTMDFTVKNYCNEKINETYEILSLIYSIGIDKKRNLNKNYPCLEQEMKNIQETLKEYFSVIKQKAIHINSLVLRAIAYIMLHYNEDISLETVAEDLKITSAYLSRLFKQYADTNFVHYLNTIRVNRAKELLVMQHYKIKDLAAEVGFINSKYFSRVFKNYTGYTPSQYLRQVIPGNLFLNSEDD